MTTVGIGILTFDMFRTGREQDFWRTWRTIFDNAGYPADLQLLTNGSTDGTQDVVEQLGGLVDNSNSQIWYGMTRLIDSLLENDLVVFSADDIGYHPGWLKRLVAFMDDAPEVALATCLMEPVWQWNQPRETITVGGELALIRDSVPGCSWCFRSRDWKEWLGPLPQQSPGEDLIVCQRVQAHGRKMAALELADHDGAERSAWGNESWRYAQPLDREEWGLDGEVTEVQEQHG